MNKVARFFALLSLGWCAAEEQCHGSQRATSLMQMKSINSKQTHQGSLRASLMYFQKFTAELVRDFEAGNARVANDREDTIKEVVRFIEDMWSSFVYPTYQDITTRVSQCTMKSMSSWTDGVKVISGTDLDNLAIEQGIAQRCWESRKQFIEAADGIEVDRANVETKRQTHKACREDRARTCTAQRVDNCRDYDQYRWYNESAWLSSYPCSKTRSRTEIFESVANITDSGERARMEFCLEKTKEWLDPLYTKYTLCDESYKKGQMADDCEFKKEGCDSDQHTYEMETCLYINAHEAQCLNLENCLDTAIQGCSGVCTDETERIAETNTDNETGETILCLLAAIFNEQQGNVDVTEGFVNVSGSDAYDKTKDEEWLVRKAKVNWCKGQDWSLQIGNLTTSFPAKYPNITFTESTLKTSLNRYLDRTYLYTDVSTFQTYTDYFKKELCACDSSATCSSGFSERFPELDAFSQGTTLDLWADYIPGNDHANAKYTTLVSSEATNGDFGNNSKPTRRPLYTGDGVHGGLPCNRQNWGDAWDRPESSDQNGITTDWEAHYIADGMLLELPVCDSSNETLGSNMLFHSLEAKCWGDSTRPNTTDCTTPDDRLGKCCTDGGACNNAYVFTRRERCLAGGCRPDNSSSAAHLSFYGAFDVYTTSEHNNSAAHGAGTMSGDSTQEQANNRAAQDVDPFEWTISSDLQGAWKVVRRTDDLLDNALLRDHCQAR